MVAGLPAKVAEAPGVGASKVIRPPATGSPKGLATVTTRGAGKAERGRVLWPSPGGDGEGEAAGLEGADVGGGALGPGDAALVGGHARHGDAGVDGRAAGEQGHGLGRPAVVGQRAEQGVGVDQVGGIEGEAGVVGEQVVAERAEGDGNREFDDVQRPG